MSRLCLLALLALCACNPAYIPNTRNTPLFGGGKEFAGAIALSSGVDAQLAYSVSDHVALMGNGSMIMKKYNNQATFNRDYRFGEAGLGFFSRSKTARVEVFAGYGMGQGNAFESYYFFHAQDQKEVVAKGTFQRIFLQPSIGTNNKKFNIILTSRFSMVNFTRFTTTDPAVDPLYRSVKPTEKFHLFLEPSLTTRFHLAGNLNGFVQLNLNAAIPNDIYFGYPAIQAAVGIQIHTGQLRTRVY